MYNIGNILDSFEQAFTEWNHGDEITFGDLFEWMVSTDQGAKYIEWLCIDGFIFIEDIQENNNE